MKKIKSFSHFSDSHSMSRLFESGEDKLEGRIAEISDVYDDIKSVELNEAYTSKINCLTGNIEFNSSLNNREFIYEDMIIDRDVNACINILKKSGLWLSQDSIKNLLLNKISELEV